MSDRRIKNQSIYGAFAATRLALARSQTEISSRYNPEMQFWFVRFELYMALLIMMENFYAASARNDPDRGATRLSNLISQMPCSYSKARQLIHEAVDRGYATIAQSNPDHRVKIVAPTAQSIAIWEAYFDEAKAIMEDTGLINILVEEELAARKARPRNAKRPAPRKSSAKVALKA